MIFQPNLCQELLLADRTKGCSSPELQGIPGWSGRHPHSSCTWRAVVLTKASRLHEMNSSNAHDISAFPESLRLLSLLWSLNAAMQRTSLDMEAKLGVTGVQRFLLRFVGLDPGVTAAQLGNVVSLDAAVLQSDLDQLVAKNLLIARSEPAGYFLTAHGASVNALMDGTVEQAVSKALDEGSAYERTSLRRMVERVIAHLDKAPATGGKA